MLHRLKRSLGLTEVVMIGLGPTIGPTIFVVPRTAIEMAGPGAIITFIIAGLFAFFTALNYARMSSRISEAGGGFSFVNKTFGSAPSLISGWSMWTGNIAYMALSAYTFGLAAAHFLHLPPSFIAVGAILLFAFLNYHGIKDAGKVQSVLTAFVLALLIAFIAYGFFNVEPRRYTPFLPDGVLPMFFALSYVYSVYIGFEIITNTSEEVKRASVLIPKAILLTTMTALVVLPATVAVLVGVLPRAEVVASHMPLINASEVLFGRAGGYLMLFATMIASLTSLNAATIATSRTLFAMSRGRYLPKSLMNIHSKFGTPHFALASSVALSIVFASFSSLSFMVYLTNTGYLIGLLIINSAGLLINKRTAIRKLPFKLPYHPFVPILAALASLIILPTISLDALLVGCSIALVGTFVGIAIHKASYEQAIASYSRHKPHRASARR